MTTAEAEYVVKQRKHIRAIPDQFTERGENTILIRTSEIFSVTDQRAPIKGLVMLARIRRSLPGLPRNLPGASLLFYGKRIRGIDYEQWHPNRDGQRIRGWHEHIWSTVDEDANVIIARPKLRGTTLFELFKWGLKKWNIEVLEKQPKQGRLPGTD